MINFRILHLEDDAEFARQLRLTLQPYGIQVDYYSDIHEGLRVFQENFRRYAAVLVDGHPSGGITGVDVIKELKEADPNVAIIAQTNFDKVLAEMFEEGAYIGLNRQLDDDHARGIFEALQEIKVRFNR